MARALGWPEFGAFVAAGSRALEQHARRLCWARVVGCASGHRTLHSRYAARPPWAVEICRGPLRVPRPSTRSAPDPPDLSASQATRHRGCAENPARPRAVHSRPPIGRLRHQLRSHSCAPRSNRYAGRAAFPTEGVVLNERGLGRGRDLAFRNAFDGRELRTMMQDRQCQERARARTVGQRSAASNAGVPVSCW